ncbi:hypothetical protein [Maribacter antarcticus]|uniref:hypothetical protein n=1 Tax=Maribacter antarcticus TaxID=505250 RepID=UPI000A7A9B5A|nr:hypothetical protein [Maribacter antarcticus]
MKKILFLTTLFAVVIGNAKELEEDTLTVPTETWSVGGNLTFNTFKNIAGNQPLISENKTVIFAVLPNIGLTIAKNTILGLRFRYSFQNTENSFIAQSTINNANSTVTNTLAIAPYVTRFFPVGKKLAFYLQGESNYANAVSDRTDQNTGQPIGQQTSNNYSIGIRPSITYYISTDFALETGIDFHEYSHTDSETGDANNLLLGTGEMNGFSFNLNPSKRLFGFPFIFNLPLISKKYEFKNL